MFRGIVATLGVGAVITGSSSKVSAQPVAFLEPDSNCCTPSAQSLREIENRNISKDYSLLIAKNLPVPETEIISLRDKRNDSVVQLPGEISNLMKRVEVSTGGSSLDSEQRVRVRLHLDTK